MITKQQMFDKVAAALLKQQRRSGSLVSQDGVYTFVCEYTDYHGCHCAIGHMLNEEDLATITRWKENRNLLGKMLSIFGKDESEEINFIRENREWCVAFQRVHDALDSIYLKDWKRELIAFAAQSNLHYKIIEEFQSL